jgi:hypothetical protein
MLKNLFARLFGDSIANGLRETNPSRWEAGLLKQVMEMTPNDPSAGAKVGGKELAARLVAAMKTNKGVHIESLMCAAGALAGYSCQAAIRTTNRSEGLDEVAGLTAATTSDGETFFFGDRLNSSLAESELSIWSIAAGAAQTFGCANILDVNAIFDHVAGSVGTEKFGVPRLPEGHPVHELPRTYLERLWPEFSPSVERFCPNPDDWSLLFGLLLQNLLMQTKDAMDCCLSLQIIMESAVPMSKVNRSAA